MKILLKLYEWLYGITYRFVCYFIPDDPKPPQTMFEFVRSWMDVAEKGKTVCWKGFSVVYDDKARRIHVLWPEGEHVCCFPHRESEITSTCPGYPYPPISLPI